MIVMAKAKKNDSETLKRGRPRGKRDVVAFQLRLDRMLHSQLIVALSQTRRLKNAEIALAVEKHLEGMGLWPPKDAQL